MEPANNMSDFGLDFDTAAYEQILGPTVSLDEFLESYNQENPITEANGHQIITANTPLGAHPSDSTGEVEGTKETVSQDDTAFEEPLGGEIDQRGKDEIEFELQRSIASFLASTSSSVNPHPDPTIGLPSGQLPTSTTSQKLDDLRQNPGHAEETIDQSLAFWHQRVQMFNEDAGHQCVGTYLELYTQWPGVRNLILQRLSEQQQGRHQAVKMNGNNTDNGRRYGSQQLGHPQPNFFSNERGNEVHIRSYGSSPGIAPVSGATHAVHVPQPLVDPAGPQTQPPPLLPLLVAVPAQRGKRYIAACPRCARDVILNGKNDGKLCTRCFNSANNHRRHLMTGTASASQAKITQDTRSPTANSAFLAQWPPSSQEPRMAWQAPGFRQDPPDVGPSGTVNGNGITAPAMQQNPLGYEQLSHHASSLPNISGASNSTHRFVSPVASEADLAASTFNLEHVDVETARDYVTRPPAEVCVQLSVEDDNWRRVKDELFNGLVGELFDAISQPGYPAPFYFTDREVAYYNHNHGKAYSSVLRDLETPEDISMAKARVMLAIDEVVGVHETGIPKTIMRKVDEKALRGYVPDLLSNCLDRARKVISYTRSSKYIALDILRGNGISELARSPDRYMGRKFDNCQTNAGRSRDLRHLRKIRTGDETAEDLVREGPRKRGAKPKVVNGIALPSSTKADPAPPFATPGYKQQPCGPYLVTPTAPNIDRQQVAMPIAPGPTSYTATTPGMQKRKRSREDKADDSEQSVAKRTRIDDSQGVEYGGDSSNNLYEVNDDTADQYGSFQLGPHNFQIDDAIFDEFTSGTVDEAQG